MEQKESKALSCVGIYRGGHEPASVRMEVGWGGGGGASGWVDAAAV